MTTHPRIEKPPAEPGKFYAVTNDRVIAVGDDGTEVDVSPLVAEWHEHSVIGSVRKIEVTFLVGYYVTQSDGSAALVFDEAHHW